MKTASCIAVTEDEKREREARSVALEKAYVHDVYDQLSHHFSEERYRPWPRVRQFLEQLEPGSLVCDAGCGNGKYLSVNPAIFKVGSDRCASLVDAARRKEHEVLICDALNLPYRDESFDAALSVAVIHHLATRDRRVRVLRELARILRVGGRILITVWAKEQRHRKFESQDILVPWRTPDRSSSEEKPTTEQDIISTTTSDEDVTHYHAYTQTSESDSCYSCKKIAVQIDGNGAADEDASKCSVCSASLENDASISRRRQRHRHHKGRSVDPHRPSCSSQSSSDLSSPNESCYSFVKGFRKALQKLANTRRASGAYQRTYRWFTDSTDCINQAGHCPVTVQVDHSCELPIELRHLDPEDDGAGGGGTQVDGRPPADGRPVSPGERSRSSPPSLGGQRNSVQSADIDRIVTCEGTAFPRPFSTSSLNASAPNNRSRSLSDLLHSLPVSVSSWLRNRLSEGELVTQSPAQDLASMCRSQSTVSWFVPAKFGCQKAAAGDAVQSTSNESLRDRRDEDSLSGDNSGTASGQSDKKVVVNEELPRRRPLLIKQKRPVQIFESYCEEDDGNTGEPQTGYNPFQRPNDKRRLGTVHKQGSMNDYLLSCDRLKEREILKRSFPRQTSLGDDKVLSCRRSPVKSNKTNEQATTSKPTANVGPPPQPPPPADRDKDKDKDHKQEGTSEPAKDFASLRNGLVRMWQSIRGESQKSPFGTSTNPIKPFINASATTTFQKGTNAVKQHFPSLLDGKMKPVYRVVSKEEDRSPSRLPPTASEEDFSFSFSKCCADQDLDTRVRPASHRLSYRDESDSSKDSSLQSDTSVDSEDSCISVIYVPRPDQTKAAIGTATGTGLASSGDPSAEARKARNSSSSSSDGSERSPKVKVFPVLVLPVPNEAAEISEPTLPVTAATNLQSSPSPKVPVALHTSPLSTRDPPNVKRNTCLISEESRSDQAVKSPLLDSIKTAQPLSCLMEDEEPIESTSPVTQPSVKPAPTTTVAEKRSSVSQGNSPLLFRRSVPRFLSFEVFNPETDDVDSDSSSVSSSDSAGSVISVGDPMWPAFQDRRQTILNNSQASSSDAAVKSNEERQQQDTQTEENSSIGPVPVETGPSSLSEASKASSETQTSSMAESESDRSSSAPQAEDAAAKQETNVLSWDEDNETGSWARNLQALERLDECHEEEDKGEVDKDRFEDETLPDRRNSSHQWKDKAKSSFSASTSSIDSSFSAPSFSSARQSSSTSAVSEMRKNSDDSAVMSTLPLIRSRPFAADRERSTVRPKVTKASSVSEDELHRLPLHHCSNLPLTKLMDGSVDDSSSVSTSQDSLPSDTGGTMTLHRYYHVFREGELDQLIERYVENLHIISSYYDHANWCIVAEKVHVWTI